MKTKQKIFIAKIISKIVIFFLRKHKVRVKRNNINWELDLREGIDLTIFIFNNFEKSILDTSNKLIQNKKLDIIDIGSNMGVHTLNFAKTYNDSKIYSIEATNFAYNKLVKNLDLNPKLNNVYHYQLFLTNKLDKQKQVYSSWNLDGSKKSHTKHHGVLKSTSNAKLISLDEFIKKMKIKKKTLIKFDVDGNELFVFKSAKNYIKKFKPYIIMELAPYLYKEYGYECKDLLEFILSFNYKFYDPETFDKIDNIFKFADDINDGTSVNIFLK
jgi:FkbM family methyltransferase